MKHTKATLSDLAWTKSSYSGPTNNCLEVAAGQLPGTLPIRDSKHPAGPVLITDAGAWTAFLSGVKRDRLA